MFLFEKKKKKIYQKFNNLKKKLKNLRGKTNRPFCCLSNEKLQCYAVEARAEKSSLCCDPFVHPAAMFLYCALLDFSNQNSPEHNPPHKHIFALCVDRHF